MKITEKEVGYVAGLARIRFDRNEMIGFTEDLQNIISYFDKLNELDTDKVESKDILCDSANVFREDIVEPSIPREDILGNVPTHDGEYLIVPNTID
jgi:aspartyl-tRNA(Asn)/glutamyl-tRNA(Gln) amidotransferase subunit C